MLGHLLVEADVPLRKARRQVWPHATEQHRHALVPARVTVVQIGENRELLAMAFQRLERRR